MLLRRTDILRRVMLGLLLLTILPMLYAWLPSGIDWLNYFRPAALAVLQGESPYTIPGYYNPPWTVLPLIPVAVLPLAWSRAVWFLVSLAGFALLARQLTDQPVSILLFLTSAPVFHCLYYGNIDWIAMLSLVALVLASVKPQVGIGVIVYLLIESWRVESPRGVARAVLPLILVLGASFLVYGFWPHHIQELGAVFWSISPFPWLVPTEDGDPLRTGRRVMLRSLFRAQLSLHPAGLSFGATESPGIRLGDHLARLRPDPAAGMIVTTETSFEKRMIIWSSSEPLPLTEAA